MPLVMAITIDPDGSIDVMHNIPNIHHPIVKVIDQRKEFVDTLDEDHVIESSETEIMEFVAEHLADGFEDKAP